MNVVWICPNAIKKEHSCDFGLCSSCYENIKPKGRTRRSKVDCDENCNEKKSSSIVCNHTLHTSLILFSDKQYFTKEWKKKAAIENSRIPHKCEACEKEFVA